MELSESKTASNRIQELNLMSQGRHKYQVRLYYNKLEPRHREKLPHSHLPMEIDWFGSGCYGTYIINGKKYSIEPGDVFVLRSKEEHSIIHLEDGDNCICTGLQFSPDFVWSPNNELGEMREVYSLFSNTNKTFKHKFGANESHAPEIRVAIREIVQEFEERRPEYSLMVKARLICLLIMFVRECGPISRGGSDPIVKRENRMHIENAMNYIDMHFMDMLTLDSLAKKAQMSSSYFSQTFKRLNGFSVWEYVLEKRIDCSERLLITTEDPILEIAMKCGFNNATNFNRAFKKITGVSPREYRLQYTG